MFISYSIFTCRTNKDSILILYDTDKLSFFFSSAFRAFLCPRRFRLLLLQRNGCRIYKLRKSELLLFSFSPSFSLFPYISLNASNLQQYADPRNGVFYFIFLLGSIFMTNYGKHVCQMFTDFICCLFRLLNNNNNMSSNGL